MMRQLFFKILGARIVAFAFRSYCFIQFCMHCFCISLFKTPYNYTMYLNVKHVCSLLGYLHIKGLLIQQAC